MFLDRVRFLGIALICAALTLVAWKTVARNREPMPYDETVRPVSAVTPAGGGELTIPVEIVEAGEFPRIHEVRIAR